MELQIRSVAYYTSYSFSENDNLYVHYLYDPVSTPSEIQLDTFVNKTDVKGAGKKLLCSSLDWIKTNLPAVKKISLASVPHSNVYKKQGMTKAQAQKKLNDYYISLGFTYSDEEDHYFESLLDTIISKACTTTGGKTRRRKQRGGANLNNNNNNYNNNNYNNNNDDRYLNKELIERLAAADIPWFREQLRDHWLYPNNSNDYIFPSPANGETPIHLTGTLVGFLAGMGIFEFHTTDQPTEKESEKLLQLFIENGASIIGDKMKDDTGGPAHFNSGTYRAIPLFMAKRYDTCVAMCIRELVRWNMWDESIIQEYLSELQFMPNDDIIGQFGGFPSSATIEYWRSELRNWKSIVAKLNHSAKMKNIVQNIEAYPERKKKQELLTELGALPPMPGFEEGGQNYRKVANFYRRISEGEITTNDPEYQEWIKRKPYNYRRAMKYTRRKG
jgi:hypothetical protein